MQGVKEIVDRRFADGIVRDVAAHQPRALQHARDRKQLARVEHAAEVRAGERGAHVLDAGKGGTAAHDHHGLRGPRLGKAASDLKGVRRGSQRKRGRLGRFSDRLGREHSQHGRQLERRQRFFKKTHSLAPVISS